jgi:hypothetical protein
MAGAAVAGLFGAAATAPLARLIIDARDITRESRAEPAAGADGAPPAGSKEPEPAAQDPGTG